MSFSRQEFSGAFSSWEKPGGFRAVGLASTMKINLVTEHDDDQQKAEQIDDQKRRISHHRLKGSLGRLHIFIANDYAVARCTHRTNASETKHGAHRE